MPSPSFNTIFLMPPSPEMSTSAIGMKAFGARLGREAKCRVPRSPRADFDPPVRERSGEHSRDLAARCCLQVRKLFADRLRWLFDDRF